METSIVTNTLSDGSKTFDVVFVDGSHKVLIMAMDEAAAFRIEAALKDNAVGAYVDKVARATFAKVSV